MLNYKRKTRRSALFLIVALFAAFVSSATTAHEIEGGMTTSADDIGEHTSVEQLIRKFRETGNDEYLDLAWEHVEHAIDDGSADPTTLIDAATIAQSRHDFARAIELLDQLLAIQPHNDQAWLLLASINTVIGDLQEARFACKQLRSQPFLVTATCLARANQTEESANHWSEILLTSLNTQRDPGVNSELLAWSQSIAADLLAQSDPQIAIRLYRSSLEQIESSQVRAALVDVLLAENNLEQASVAIHAGESSLPLTVRRFIVAKRMNELDTVAGEIDAANHEFRHWIASNDWQHAREMARFYVDVMERPDLARQLAVRNVEFQMEPEDRLLEQRTRNWQARQY